MYRLLMSLIKTQSNCRWSAGEFQWLLGEKKLELPLCAYVDLTYQWWDRSGNFLMDCNTISRWCWLKHSLSARILNAWQSKSNPVCATVVYSLTFPPPGSAKPCYSDEKRLNTMAGKGHAWCENILVIPSWLSFPLSNPCWLNNETDALLVCEA